MLQSVTTRPAGNRSGAVMSQRVEPHDSLDFFPTPPYAVRALMEKLVALVGPLDGYSVLEPACGEGHIARTLEEQFGAVIASDIFHYGYGSICGDYLLENQLPGDIRPDLVVTNPPYKLALEFISKALEDSSVGVAMFLRTQFLESQERYEQLFRDNPPTVTFVFSERVVLVKGRVVSPDWINPVTMKPYSTATSYSWFVWLKSDVCQDDADELTTGSRVDWIAPCRKRLERKTDFTDLDLQRQRDGMATRAWVDHYRDGKSAQQQERLL